METIVYNNSMDIQIRGQERWYFESLKGKLPYMMLSKECMELLEVGKAAIIELPNGKHKIVNERGARIIYDLSPSSVRVWHHTSS